MARSPLPLHEVAEVRCSQEVDLLQLIGVGINCLADSDIV